MSASKIDTLSHHGNILEVRLSIQAQTNASKFDVCSQDYQLRHIARLKIRVNVGYQECLIFIRFNMINDLDPKYMLKITCKALELYDKICMPDSSEQYLEHLKGNTVYNVTMSMIIDIVPRSNMFELLYGDEDLTDFELRGSDGSVNFHKLVLAVWSPVFKTMFSGKWKENKEGHIEIKSVTVRTLEQLKVFMYLQKLPDNEVDKLLSLARCYMILDLEQRCVDRLLSSLTVHNTWDLMKFAVTQEMPKLFGQLLMFLDQKAIQDIGNHYTMNNSD